MAQHSPDERHDFAGWSVERFGDLHFLEWHELRSYGPPSGRVEITAADYRALLTSEIAPGKLIRKYDNNALSKGLENPGLGVRVFLVTSLVLIGSTLVALLVGWV